MCFNSLNYKRKEIQQEGKSLERCYFDCHFMDFFFKFSRCFKADLNVVEGYDGRTLTTEFTK